MSIKSEEDLEGIKRVSEAVAFTLRQMREHAKPSISTKEPDNFGLKILQSYHAQSVPKITYDFPGYTCISINNEAAHGILPEKTVLKEGDLVHIDVSAEPHRYYADNGGSFIVGEDIQGLTKLVDTSAAAMNKALKEIQGEKKIAEVGCIIETEAIRTASR